MNKLASIMITAVFVSYIASYCGNPYPDPPQETIKIVVPPWIDNNPEPEPAYEIGEEAHH